MNLPSLGDSDLFYYLNIAYNKITTLDVSDWVFLNQNDNRFPYPILYQHEPYSQPMNANSDSEHWYENWQNYFNRIMFPITEEFLVDSDKSFIDFVVGDNGEIPISCRKVVGIFTFCSPNTMSDFPEIYKPFQSNFGLYTRYQFVKIPFKSINATHSTVAKVQFYHDLNKIRYPIFVEFLYLPPPINSVKSPCLIDLKKWGTDLLYGAKSYYQQDINGKSDDVLIFENRILQKISMDKNKDENSVSPRFPSRI